MSDFIRKFTAPRITSGSTFYQPASVINWTGSVNVYEDIDNQKAKIVAIPASSSMPIAITSSIDDLTFETTLGIEHVEDNGTKGNLTSGSKKSYTIDLPYSTGLGSLVTAQIDARVHSGSSTLYWAEIDTVISYINDSYGDYPEIIKTVKTEHVTSSNYDLNIVDLNTMGKLDKITALLTSSTDVGTYTISGKLNKTLLPVNLSPTSQFEQYGAVAHWDARFNTTVVSGADNSVGGKLQSWTDIIGGVVATQTRSVNLVDWGFNEESPFPDKYFTKPSSSIADEDHPHLQGDDRTFLNYFSGSHTVAVVARTVDVSKTSPYLSVGQSNTFYEHEWFGRIFNARPVLYFREQGLIRSINDASQDVADRKFWAIFKANLDTTTGTIILDDGTEYSDSFSGTGGFDDADIFRIGCGANINYYYNSVDYVHDIIVFDELLTGSNLDNVKTLLNKRI